MATTDPNGLVVLQGTDIVTPLHAVINTVTASISAAINNIDTAPTLRVYSANATWTKPAHLLAIRVRMTGGGGAGGGAGVTVAAQMSAGGGGGAGASSEAWFLASSLAPTVSVTCGTGGVGATGAVGGNGNDTSFGTLLTAPGGTGGSFVGSAAGSTNVSGGAGGTVGTVSGASGDSFRLAGQPGGRAWFFPSSGIVDTSEGGSNALGTGAAQVSWNTTGMAGGVGGGGGGGALNLVSQATARAGGAGGVGVVIIEEFYGAV